MGQVFEVTPDKIQKTKTGCILNVEKHPADNPNNRKLVDELQVILVVSENCPKNTFKMVLRRRGGPDEELTYFRQLRFSEENPGGDDLDYNRVAISMLRHCITRKGLPEVKQYSATGHQPNTPFKFINPGDNICWGNSALQTFLHTSPDIRKDLIKTMDQPSDSSEIRDLPRMLLNISDNFAEQQSLNQLRFLLAPESNGGSGIALRFFEKIVDKLQVQSPTAIDGFRVEHELYETAKQCSTKDCIGTMPSSSKIRRRNFLLLFHNQRIDGLNAQNTINRFITKELEKPYPRSCTENHRSMVKRNVTCTKMPQVFLINALNARLDQENSMEVQLSETKYRAIAIIHHREGRPGHHWCSLWISQQQKWFQIDDYHNEQTWKKPYYFNSKENVFKCGEKKLFDNLGTVFYERIGRERIIREPEINREETSSNWQTGVLVNFHTTTDSGQQLLASFNGGQRCYITSTMAAFAGNPFTHSILRNCSANGSLIEQYLYRLCRMESVFRDTEAWKQLVIAESTRITRIFHDLERGINFKPDTQQDAEEYITGLLETLCDIEGNQAENPPLSVQTRQALNDTIGFTLTETKWCSDCKEEHSKAQKRERILKLTLNAGQYRMSVNSYLKTEMAVIHNEDTMTCSKCRKKGVKFSDQKEVSQPKNCVIIQLMRFVNIINRANGQVATTKITTPVEVDEVLDGGPLTGYLFTGGILHDSNTMMSGHYTHILRDVVSGKYWKTNDDQNPIQLSAKEAKDQLSKHGYLFFYSSPEDIPPPLKRTIMNKVPVTPSQKKSDTTPRGSKRKVTSSTKLFTSGNFKTLNGEPDVIVKVPQIPAILSSFQCESLTPFEDEMTANIEDNWIEGGKQIIDPNSPLAVALKANFGHSDFRTKEQRAATEEIAAGKRDVLVVMPTGSGKSLTYQLAAVMQKKLAIIIAPTIALAQDQVAALMKRKLQARLLTADVCIHSLFNFL